MLVYPLKVGTNDQCDSAGNLGRFLAERNELEGARSPTKHGTFNGPLLI